MKKIVVLCVFMLSISTYSQNQDYQGRVGINTLEPKATLDISEKSNLPEGHAQGVSFPNFTTEKREKFQDVKGGTMIYNTDKQCLEICIPSGISCEWQCMEPKHSLPKVTLSDVTVYVPSFKDISSNPSLQQGKIDNVDRKIKVKIPYRGGRGSYKAISIESMTSPGQDGNRKMLILKIPGGSFDRNPSGFLEGEIESEGGEYLVGQLSLGDESSISEFIIRTDSGVWSVSLKGTGGIPDRCYNKTTNQCWGYGEDEQEHQFVYVPMQGPKGRIWLSQNLGAEYSNVNSSDFDPGKGDFLPNDHKAYGSMFQWQRPSDGHELINWTNSPIASKYGSSSTVSTNSNWQAIDNEFIKNNLSPHSWVNSTVNSSSSNKNLWQKGGSNNPCPEGYHVPTKSELVDLNGALISNGKKVWNHPIFRLSASGDRNANNAALSGQGRSGGYWSSEQDASTVSWRLNFGSVSSSLFTVTRATGQSVRCLKD